MIHPALTSLLDRYQPQTANDYLSHLEARMRQSGDWLVESPLDTPALRERPEARFSNIRFDLAKEDIEPFLKDPRELALWSEGFFMGLIPLIQVGESCVTGPNKKCR